MKRKLKNLLYQNRFNNLSNYRLLLLVALFFNFKFYAQIINYVSNGSFESLNSNSITSLYNTVNYWQPIDTGKFCDYLITTRQPISNAPGAFGYQYPRTGDNYIGSTFFCANCSFNPRGYPRNRLKSFLQSGKTYCVKFHVVNTNNSPFAIENFGAYFGTSQMDTINYCNIPLTYLTPQVINTNGIITDTMNWVPITGTFVANGNEKYLVLGNFKSDSQTNTVLINPTFSATIVNDVCIDDVSCIDIDLPAYAGPDAWILPGDSVFIGRQPDVGIDEACMWFKMPNTTIAIDTVAGLWVKPTVTTSYLVRQEICGNVKWDLVTVYISATGSEEYQSVTDNLKVYPQPASNEISLSLNIKQPEEFKEIEIYNNLGSLIKEEEVEFVNKECKIKTDDLPNGIYILSLKNEKGFGINKRLVIAR
jgi:hypothetical protein